MARIEAVREVVGTRGMRRTGLLKDWKAWKSGRVSYTVALCEHPNRRPWDCTCGNYQSCDSCGYDTECLDCGTHMMSHSKEVSVFLSKDPHGAD